VLENDEGYDTDLTEEAWALIAPILSDNMSRQQANTRCYTVGL